ncbi:MAG: YbaB/EbfC family nucleoid-associated protein [Candidatus Pacebacteria bacterium]|nr:YbaB/EbfC family nucleoid-associated protein [Candidatus Paceibacterota bacterium]MDD5013346.1 YbaB/EbfC family nucleoid-associated protein [Candidatus Paceibacterota bacterium]MDD5752708.1 YbaB/EbfC family nucleoid-associated protein [Candidatus Paceibacterota bacterium]
MFDKLKQLKRLKDFEDSLSKERLEKEIDGTKVVINGKTEIISITLNPELSKEKQEEVLKECINNVSRDAKMIMAKKAQEITGMGF